MSSITQDFQSRECVQRGGTKSVSKKSKLIWFIWNIFLVIFGKLIGVTLEDLNKNWNSIIYYIIYII